MDDIGKNLRDFEILIKKFLKDKPHGFPKNEIWGELKKLRHGKTFLAKDFGVTKLGLVFGLYSFLEEKTFGDKLCITLRSIPAKAKKGNISNTRPADMASGRKGHNSGQKGNNSGRQSQHDSTGPKGLLDIEFLGPAIWQPPGMDSVPRAAEMPSGSKGHNSGQMGSNSGRQSQHDSTGQRGLLDREFLGPAIWQPPGMDSVPRAAEMPSGSKGHNSGQMGSNSGRQSQHDSTGQRGLLGMEFLGPPVMGSAPVNMPSHLAPMMPRNNHLGQMAPYLTQDGWPALHGGIQTPKQPTSTRFFTPRQPGARPKFVPVHSQEFFSGTYGGGDHRRHRSLSISSQESVGSASYDQTAGPDQYYGQQNVSRSSKPVYRGRSIDTVQRTGQQTGHDKLKVENMAKVCIDQLSEAGEYVSMERVEKLLLQRLQVNTVRDLNIYRVNAIEHLQVVNEHVRLLNKVNAYIQAFVQVRSICTLHELEANMKEFGKDGADFEALKIGPMQKLPMIYNMFKFPPDEKEIPEITAMAIFQHLRDYLSKENKWTEKAEMEPLMDYLVTQYDVADAYHLGVRIRSLPLAIQMLKKAQREAANSRRSILDGLKTDLQNDIADAVQRFRVSVLQPTSSAHQQPGFEIRQHYLQTPPETAIMEIFSKFQLLISLEQPEAKHARKRHMRLVSTISDFLNLVREEKMASSLFHLAICVGALDLQEMLQDILGGEVTQSEDINEAAPLQQIKTPPPIGKLVEKLQSYLDRCLTHGSVTLEHMHKIEEYLLRDFEFPSFQAMGLNSFLWFLLNQSEAKVLLEQNCGLSLGSSNNPNVTSGYKPSFSDILHLIKQTEGAGITETSQLEDFLCSQFNVSEVRHLGYGMIDRLKKAAMKSGRHQLRESHVLFEAALCPSNRKLSGAGQVGILGHQTKDSARACLHNCPLLEDLSDWSYWPFIFEPELGPLKEFIQKYGGLKHFEIEDGSLMVTTDIVAMESRPGHLIKLVSQTSVEKFVAAVKQGNIDETCGHLLSQIAASKSVSKTSVALLTNHIKAALFSLNGQSQEEATLPGGPPQAVKAPNKAVLFILQCLSKLPMRICVSLAEQMLLNPLGEVLGVRQSKMLLLQLAKPNALHLSRLHKLGCLLGIQEWTKSLEARFQYPADAIVVTNATSAESQLDVDETWLDIPGQNAADKIIPKEDDSESSDFLEDSGDDESSSDSDSGESSMEEVTTTTLTEQTAQEEDQGPKVSSTAEELSGETTEESSEGDITQNACKDLIDQVRREEFGIGMELSENGQKLMKVHEERLGRSLDRLSKDLYSKDTHFVLELVQNADDNSYPTDSEITQDFCPMVEFVVEADKVTVRNNECGFEEKNIRALCDVGRSTKGKHKYGYIGQKGIGFKSVFRVTDAPEVHSNGFHIKFDVNSGPTGYILPHWVETELPSDGWMTQIILPFKKDVHEQTLAARFNDIHPSLLLFLNRLKQITISNKIGEGYSTSMKRRDLKDNVVEIEHAGTTDRWLVVRKTLDASQISLQAKSGIEVESTEIAMAFPIKKSGQRNMSQVLPPKQDVFAFLPLHSYGFRFIIQGDFDVPSSREDVVKDSAWNQWLRDEFPSLFIEALDVFKEHADFSLMDAICSYLQLVPNEDEVLDFFQPVACKILQRLKGKNCIPTHPNSKSQVFMKKPSQVITTKDSLVKEVVNADMLQKHLNLYYLHGDLAVMLNPSLTSTLGIETVTTQHLLQVGEALALSIQSGGIEDFESNILQVSKWLACVCRSMDDLNLSSEVLSSLKTMDIIPLSAGHFTSLTKCTVFFPIAKTVTKGRRHGTDPFRVLQTDLSAVHPKLLETPDKVINSQVERLLQQMGVKSLSPSEVIGHHIMPVLQSDTWKEKSVELLTSYILYVKLETDKNPNLVKWEEFKDVVQVSTNQGLKNPVKDSIHFTPEFGNKVNLQEALPGYNWILLDRVYLAGCTQHSDLLQWRNFFSKLGVLDQLSVKQEKVHLSNLDDSVWSRTKDLWPKFNGGYIISDCVCEEFRMLVIENTLKEDYSRQMKTLCELIDSLWESYYSSFQTVTVSDSDGNNSFPTNSSFGILLQSSPWLPGIKTKAVINDNDHIRLEETPFMAKPADLYLPAPEIKSLLYYTVPYVHVNFLPQSSFMSYLQIRTSVDTNAVQKLLIGWSNREKENEPATFCSSLSHIKFLYCFLFDRLSMRDAQDLLCNNPVIFVPIKKITAHVDMKAPLNGIMLRRDEIWWNDPTGLFQKRHASLKEFHVPIADKRTIANVYFDMERYFTGQFGHIQHQPTISEYAQLWIHIAETDILSKDSHALRDVLFLISHISENLQQAGDLTNPTEMLMLEQEKKKLLQVVQNPKMFPTKKNTWVSLNQHPLIADHPVMEKLFQDKENVHFLQLQEKQRPVKHDLRRLKEPKPQEGLKWILSLFGINPLSSSISAMEVSEFSKPSPHLQMSIHKVVPYIQQYLYSLYNDDVYQVHIKDKTAELLPAMSFMEASSLEVVYSLKHSPDTVVRQKESCMFDFTSNAFIFQKDNVQNLSMINREIAKFFSKSDPQCLKDLSGFLAEMTCSDVDEVLERHEVLPIPEDEVPWQIPKPVIQLPPPPVVEEVMEASDEQKLIPPSDGALRAWPPQSSVAPLSTQSSAAKANDDLPKSNVWPPPKPPQFMDVRQLPDRFKLPPSGERVHEQGEGSRQFQDPQNDPRLADGGGDRKQDGSLFVKRAESDTSQTAQGTGEVTGEKKRLLQNQGSDRQRPTTGGETDLQGAEGSSAGTPGEQQHKSAHIESTESSPSGRKRLLPGELTTPSPKKPSLQLSAPVWDDNRMSDTMYEELGKGDNLKFPEDIELDIGGEIADIGDWGERLVRDYLRKMAEDDQTILFINWSKETGNELNPYDFEIVIETPTGHKSIFIEVKTTLSSSKETFEISSQEMRFAFDKKDCYFIYRVYGAGSKDLVRLVRIQNVAYHLDKKNIHLCIVV